MKLSSTLTRYESPLNKLDRLTLRYRRQDVLRNRHYQDRCERKNDFCQLFQPPDRYQSIFIHRQTSHELFIELIHLASQTYFFTIDTQYQVEPYPWAQHYLPALIQIEFHSLNRTPLVILLEVFYIKSTILLETRDYIKEQKIKQLCQFIFAPNKHIFLWGNYKEKLSSFYSYQLFNSKDLDQINFYNIHDYFTYWYQFAYPLSKLHYHHHPHPHPQDQTRTEDYHAYTLQSALFLVFNQWLNTRMKYAAWNCGIDTSLKTYHHSYSKSITNIHLYQSIREEIEYRQQMQTYALFNCFALTQLTYFLIQQWPLLQQSHIQPSMFIIHYKRKKRRQTFV